MNARPHVRPTATPQLTRGFFGVFRYSRRALELVWTTNKALSIALALLTLIAGMLPAAVAWVGAHIVDAVIAAIRASPDARAAATLILLRDSDAGPEVLLVRRNPEQRFMGGAWVFPGGATRADDEDERRTAVRELEEEAGIVLAEGHELVRFSRWITPAQVKVRFDTHFVTSRQWESYPILTFGEAPHVTVELIDRPEQPSKGAGEGAQGPTGGAIVNALYNAAGVRVRELPLTRSRIVAAMG